MEGIETLHASALAEKSGVWLSSTTSIVFLDGTARWAD